MSSDRSTARLGFLLEALGPQARGSFLAEVAYEMTIRARETYEPGTHGVSEPARLRAINEVMHRLTHRTWRLSRGIGVDGAEVEFWQSLFEIAEQGGCLRDLTAATSAAVKMIRSNHVE